MKGAQLGRFSQPRQLCRPGEFFDKPDGAFSLTFRPPIQKPDKIRLTDDLKHSETNRYALIWPPIALPTWGALTELFLRAHPSKRDIVFGKVGHSSY